MHREGWKLGFVILKTLSTLPLITYYVLVTSLGSVYFLLV